jgi:murein DD-endopeptidase MepM/ murein hydrolase activator NlpD
LVATAASPTKMRRTRRRATWPSKIRRARPGSFVVVAAVVAGLLAPVGPAFADPHDEQAQVDREIASTRAALESASDQVADAAVALQRATAQLPGARARLADARGILAGAQAQADTAQLVTQVAADRLALAGQAYDQAANQLEARRDEAVRYATLAYEGRDVAGLNAMLSVQNPAGFVAGLSYLDYVAADQRAALDATTAARTDARNAQNAQALQKRTADEAQERFDQAVRAASAAQVAADQDEQQVAALIAQCQQALAVAEQNRQETENRLAELQLESDRIEADIRALANSGTSQVVRVGSRLPMPVVGWKSSEFGWRYDPFYKRWQLHAGVDLAAPAGTPIWAAMGGQVIRAGWNGGYGNYTCIYHGTYAGQGFATCYAHQSAILVTVGQQVRQGEVIGRVGTTGASTGNHLHFEVRLDGKPVDPVPWLPACLC